MAKIRVLHLITELSRGGAQTALFRLVERMDREEFEQSVVCLYNGNSLIGMRLSASGIPVIDLGMNSKWRLDAFWRLYRLLRQEKPHILHTWLFHANIPGRLLGRLAGVPVLLTSERTMAMEGFGRRWLNWVTSRFSDRVLCVSNQVAAFNQETIGIPKEKIEVIPNGVPLEEFSRLPSRAEVRERFGIPVSGLAIGTVGRAEPAKGLDLLLDAYAILSEKFPEAYLVIAGNGRELESLKSQAAESGIRGRVYFLGDQDDIPGVLAAMDLFVLPSRFEGLPNALLEAMAASLPVVATDAGGVGDAVVDGETGILVPPGDSQSLEEAICRLLLDADARRRMGLAGRQRAKEFDISKTVEKTASLYRCLLKRKRTIA